MLNTYKLIKKQEVFIGKDGKQVETIGFYLRDEYGTEIKITNVFNRDFYVLLKRAESVNTDETNK